MSTPDAAAAAAGPAGRGVAGVRVTNGVTNGVANRVLDGAPGQVVEVPVELATGGGYADTVHGGRALAWVTGAVMGLADPQRHPHPVAVSAAYPAAPQGGAGTVVVRRLRAGRTFAGFAATLVQDGTVRLEALVTAGRLPAADEPDRWASAEAAAPQLPDREDCVGGSRHIPSHGRRAASAPDGSVTLRLDPAWAPPPYGPGGHGDLRGWITGTEPDPALRAIVLADGLPPVTFDLDFARGWVPTVQYQVTLRRLPPDGWLKARQWGTLAAGGLLDESCTLWAPGGAVVAQARQLAAYRE